MKLTFTIENTTAEKQKLVLFDAITNSLKANGGLPESISVQVKNELDVKVPYEAVLAMLMVDRTYVQVASSTNNQQLSFFQFVPGKMRMASIYPSLTIDGRPRPRRKVKLVDSGCRKGEFMWGWEYTDTWQADKWNIADTHEHFQLDKWMYIELHIEPLQTFEISLEALPKLELNIHKHILNQASKV